MNSQMLTFARQIILSEKNHERAVIERLMAQDCVGCVIAIGVNLVFLAREQLDAREIRQYALRRSCAALLKAGVSFILHDDSGFTFLLTNSSDSNLIKRICCDIEEGNRLLDIDVYDQHGCVSRVDIGLTERKCFLCNNTASWCIFNQTHTAEELLEFTLTTYKQMVAHHEK
ncbi:MAG: citrate lyase holo-[acyl-carrier protein] synthase [Vibrio sp.]